MQITGYTFRTRNNGYDDGHRNAATAFGSADHHLPEPEDGPNARETFVLSGYGQDIKGDTNAIYLWDDGTQVIPLYVAGWNSMSLYLNRFPLSEGTGPDGRPVDMSGWMLTPRRAYHLKVEKV